MKRLTVKDLGSAIAAKNANLLHDQSIFELRERGAYGYQRVEVHCMDAKGDYLCLRLLESGTSRECIQAVHGFYEVAPKITRQQAARLANDCLSLAQDFHELTSSEVEWLDGLRKKCGYRAPSAKARKGSKCRYFWTNLQRTFKKMGGDL